MDEVSDHSLSSSLELAGIGIWHLELANDRYSCSSGWKLIRGYTASDSVGTSQDDALTHVHPDEREELQSRRASLVDGQQDMFTFEYRVQHKNGSWIWIEERTHAVRDHGNVVQLHGCEIDITRRKQSEEFRDNYIQKNVPFDTLPVAIMQFEDRKCIYVNDHWNFITGRPPESALGDGWLDAIHPDDRKQINQFRKEIRLGTPGEELVADGCDCRMLAMDGSARWVAAKSRRRYGPDGELASSIVVLTDITFRNQLERQQERLLEILEATTDFIGISTPQREILWRNKRLAELRPILSETADFEDVIPEWSRKIMREVAMPTVIEKGSWWGETAIFDAEDNEIPVSQVLISHKGPDGSVEAVSTIMRDISQQKATEQALRESEQKFASLAAAAPVAIFRFDETGKECVYVNERWCEQTGRPREAALGQGFKEYIHPDDLQGSNERYLVFVNDKHQLVREPVDARHILPDGSTSWVQIHLAKELDKNGNVTGYVGTLSDISRIKQAEDELRQLHERLRKVLEYNSIGIWEWIWADEQLVWDDQMFEIYGVDPATFRGTHADWSDRLHPDDFERATTEDTCRVEEEGSAANEFRIIRPDGEVRHIYSNVFVEKNEQGEPIRTTGVNVDITNQRNVELALLESETKFQRVAEHVPGMVYRYIVRKDGSHDITYVNSQCRDMYEVEPEEALEDADRIYTCIHPDDREQLNTAGRESADNLTPFKEEFRVVLPKQGLRWRLASGKPTRTADGDTVWDGLTIDITNRKLAEQQSQLANEQLAKATKMKDEFLANMSHELRTPLNAILGTNEGLQEGIFGQITEKQRESFDVIQQSGSHLLDLINEILDLAKIEAGTIDLEFSTVDVEKLCDSSLQLVTQQAEKKNIQLTWSVPDDLPALLADKKRLRQVLVNLLGNAVKFTPDEGAVDIDFQRVENTIDSDDAILKISVTDNGIGIAPGHLETLFDPFVQVDSSLSRNYTGTGLGLSLVKRFVELHSGTVSVASQPKVGSCFVVELPYRQPANPDAREPQPCNQRDTGDSTKSSIATAIRPATVLLAEDNESVANATRCYLESVDFQVLSATDGESAIEVAQTKSPDIILMDIQMPGLDGFSAIKRIRSNPSLTETPIIALTGLAMPTDAARCYAAGANHYLSKPYSMSELVKRIRELVDDTSKK